MGKERGSRLLPGLRLVLLLLLLLALAAGALGLAPGLLLTAAAPRARRRFGTWCLQTWAGAVSDLLGLRLRVSGEMPCPPFLLVANHLSYVDILALASLLPCVFVAKAEVRRWPLLGPLCAGVGTVFLDRRRPRELPRVLAAVEAALAAGQGVVFFPEGTSSPGSSVLPFRSPLLALATRLDRPVHYVALRYETPEGSPPAEQAVCWRGDMELVPHLLALLRLPRITADLRFGPGPLSGSDRKQLAEELRAEVAARLGEMSPGA